MLMTPQEADKVLAWLDECDAALPRNVSELKSRVYGLRLTFVKKLKYDDGDDIVKAANDVCPAWWSIVHDVRSDIGKVWAAVSRTARQRIDHYFPDLRAAA